MVRETELDVIWHKRYGAAKWVFLGISALSLLFLLFVLLDPGDLWKPLPSGAQTTGWGAVLAIGGATLIVGSGLWDMRRWAAGASLALAIMSLIFVVIQFFDAMPTKLARRKMSFGDLALFYVLWFIPVLVHLTWVVTSLRAAIARTPVADRLDVDADLAGDLGIADPKQPLLIAEKRPLSKGVSIAIAAGGLLLLVGFIMYVAGGADLTPARS